MPRKAFEEGRCINQGLSRHRTISFEEGRFLCINLLRMCFLFFLEHINQDIAGNVCLRMLFMILSHLKNLRKPFRGGFVHVVYTKFFTAQ